jgi:hypothetical protein
MNWKPGIGDPTFVGWFTVFAYFSTAALCGYVAHRLDRRTKGAQRRTWWILALVLIALGINKQLDLQGLLTDWGRAFAYRHGFYENRRALQLIFLFLLVMVSLTALLLLFRMNRHVWHEQGFMLVGSVVLVAFVFVRAASFHHFQEFFALPLGGVRLHRVIELFALASLAAASLKRIRDLRQTP